MLDNRRHSDRLWVSNGFARMTTRQKVKETSGCEWRTDLRDAHRWSGDADGRFRDGLVSGQIGCPEAWEHPAESVGIAAFKFAAAFGSLRQTGTIPSATEGLNQ